MDKLIWQTPEDTRRWVRAFGKELIRPCVVLLSGNLGAGKTQLVKWFLQEQGVDTAASPTFAIHQEYQAKAGRIDHVDLFRLQSDSDLESTGFWDLLQADDRLLFVEWAERLPEDVWPKTWRKIFIQMRKVADEARSVEIRIQPKRP